MLLQILLILVLLAVLFPAIRRRLGNVLTVAIGAFMVFLLVITLVH